MKIGYCKKNTTASILECWFIVIKQKRFVNILLNKVTVTIWNPLFSYIKIKMTTAVIKQ